MKRKKDLTNSFVISGGAVEIYEFLEIFLKSRIDRCQLVSVNITFSIVDGHFGELFSHAVTTGKFTFLTFTTLFTLIEHETSFLASHWTWIVGVLYWMARIKNDPGINKTNNKLITTKPHWVDCKKKKWLRNFKGCCLKVMCMHCFIMQTVLKRTHQPPRYFSIFSSLVEEGKRQPVDYPCFSPSLKVFRDVIENVVKNSTSTFLEKGGSWKCESEAGFTWIVKISIFFPMNVSNEFHLSLLRSFDSVISNPLTILKPISLNKIC